MAKEGTLYIVSAPSGAGKTSLVHALAKDIPNIRISVSYTTREQRPGETNDINYHFISKSEFHEMQGQGIFLEHAKVFGCYYGTSRTWVEETLKNEDVILEIDWQGARQIRTQFVDAISIFILPPSLEDLRERLRKRHRDNFDIIESRMKDAKTELSKYLEYDYLVYNEVFEDALNDMKAIVQARRLTLKYQQNHLRDAFIKLGL